MEITFSVILGVIFGSFFNVLIYRLPRDLSIVRPRSFCPHCNQPIPFYHNFPLLSYILLRGKSSCCQKRIPFRYFLVELLTSLTFLYTYLRFGLTVYGIFNLIFLCINLLIIFSDLETMIIPDQLSIGGTILFLIYSFFHPLITPLNAFLTACGAALIFYLLFVIYLKIKKIEALGGGDIKMVAFLGAFLGAEKLLLTVLFASLLGLVAAIVLIIFKKKNLQTALPFGSFLGTAAYLIVIFGNYLLEFGFYW